jgi:hypoxanthine phosphoribosyltransferase
MTWEEVEKQLTDMHAYLREKPPFDVTLMIPRGGLFPGLLLQRRDESHYGHVVPLHGNQIPVAPRMLLIDDVWDSGATLNSLMNVLKEHCQDITVVTLACKQFGTPHWHAFSGKLYPASDWLVFPWEVYDGSNSLSSTQS